LEDRVLGILLVGRYSKRPFNSLDSEFVRQLSEHVALAAQNTQLLEELQKAYDDIRVTQKAMMEQERLRAMGQMASGLSHDINNALGPITLYTESLLEDEENLSEKAKRYLKTIQTATEDIAGTVSRMREFYRKREEETDLLPVELNKLVPQVIERTQPRWKNIPQEHGAVIHVTTDLQEEMAPIAGIEGDIRDALTNLIFNAVDAMPEGGTLTIRTRTENSTITLEVLDTGIGMDEETRTHCLEPFYTKKGERGTGLGLAMVYGVMERHQGELEIESEPGKGTHVRLIFPLRKPGDPALNRETATVLPPLRILCIDDDPLMRDSLKEILEKDGHRVWAAEGGQAGLALFKEKMEQGKGFDMVITDLGMPYMDGKEVARRIKNESPDTPILLLTGWGMRISAEGSLPDHVDQVMSKPPKVSELRYRIVELAKG
jgi:signal transduction histidine kinase/ActR/RegA family two-component response regulator